MQQRVTLFWRYTNKKNKQEVNELLRVFIITANSWLACKHIRTALLQPLLLMETSRLIYIAQDQ